MKMRNLSLLLAVWCYLAPVYLCALEPCKYGSDPCICTAKNIQYNLRPLMNSRGGEDLSKPGDATFIYYIQPCNQRLTTKNLNLCARTLVSCQVATDGNLAYGLGEINKYTVEGNSESFTLENSYAGSDVTRKLELKVNCSTEDYNLTYNGYTPGTPIVYKFTLLTRYVCKGGGGGGGGESSSDGLSIGSIMVIIFFVLLVVYLVGGILFLKFGKKAQGREVVPNYGFWTTIPLLIKEGVYFTFHCCRRNPAYGQI